MTTLCNHNSQIEDFNRGDVVCTDCGLVMDQIYCSEHRNSKWNTINVNHINYNLFNGVKNISKKYLSEEKDLLLTLCDKLHLNESVKTTILQYWEKVKTWLTQNKPRIKLNLRGLVVMALYEGLIIEKTPRPMSHLCQDAGVEPKIVWRLIKLYKQNNYGDRTEGQNNDIFKTTEMIEYFLQPLKLTFQEIQAVKEKVKFYEGCSFAPRTLVAACAYTFLKETKNLNPSVKNTARILGISVMSLYRCYKKIAN